MIETALSQKSDKLVDVTKYWNNKQFVPQLLADELLRDYTIVTPPKQDPFFFDKEKGIYQPAEELIKEQVRFRLGQEANTNRVNEVFNHIRDITRIKKNEEPPLPFIPLLNGVLDIETKVLMPASPDNFFTTQFPLKYEESAECPEIDQFLLNTLDEDGQEFFYELCAYCLWRAYPIQSAVVFRGDGANGKTTTLNLLKAFLGEDNIASVSLQDIGANRFAAVRLEHKYANLYDDLDFQALKSTGIFKMLTGGGHLPAEQKHRDAHEFTNYAKLIFCANILPMPDHEAEDSFAFFRRWTILPFNKNFVGEQCDPTIGERIVTETELSGLLNKALERLPTILKRNGFIITKSADEVRKNYMRESDPVSAFSADYLLDDSEAVVSKDEVYQAYQQFCKDNGDSAPIKDVFNKRLKSKRVMGEEYATIKGERIRCWKGIKLVKKSPEIEEEPNPKKDELLTSWGEEEDVQREQP